MTSAKTISTLLLSGWCCTTYAVASAPPVPANPESALKDLERLRANHSYFVADAKVTDLLKQYPNNADVELAAARLHNDMGLLQRAESEYLQVLFSRPKFSEAYAELSTIYLEKLDMPKALSFAQRAYETNPNSATKLGLASAYLAAGKFKDAEAELGQLLKSEPGNAQVQYLAYELALSLNQTAIAQKHLEQAIAKAPEHVDWRIELSDLYRQGGNSQAARHALVQALTIEPESLNALAKLAVIYEFYLYDYDQAIDQYNRILRIDPDSVSALAGLERCRVKKNDIAGAIKLQLQNMFSNLNGAFRKNQAE